MLTLKYDGAAWQEIGRLEPNPPNVTGSRGGNAALASLLTKLASIGLITDGSS
jgi:hypothetical protein